MLLALVRRYLRPYRWPVVAVMVLQTLSSLASLYLPTINAAIIDDGVAAGDTALIFRLGLVMLAVTALQGIVAIGAVYFGSRTGMGFGRDLRAAMFSHVISLSETETARFGAPTLLTRTTNDVRQVQVLVQMTATVLVTAPIMGIGGIAMAVHQDAGLAWLLAVSVPVLAVGNFLIVSRMLPIFRSMQQRIDAINRILREQLAGVRVVRAFGREPFEEQRFDAANHAVADATLVAGRWQALMLPVTTLTINISSVALIFNALAKGYDFFTYYFTLFLTPTMFLSGVFFPLDQLPPLVRLVADWLPLSNAVALVRPLFMDQWPRDVLHHGGVLVAYAVVSFWVALAADSALPPEHHV